MREIVERRIRYLQDDEEGGPPRAVTLPDGFIRALLAPRASSTLPVLVAVSDVPVVTPNGKVIVAGGFHPESGIFFTCSEDEARAILPADPSPAAVRQAYLYLAQELFVDVALQDRTKGMAALVACLLTAMSHPVLPEKPVFRITAPQRGSGKTTVVNMIVRPITRRSAAAASWSVNEEERRKSFFAVAREGHGILMIDNIPRGTVIRDATIERFATSAEVRDRVLGESRTEAVRSPVVVLTGNALQMGGDSGSRTLTVELTADRPDPENRPFKHPDILGWCDRNRAQILRSALTILLGSPTLRTRAAKIETRFKAWFVLVGSAVEHASKLADMPARMVDLFAQSEGEDETVGVLVELLGLLRQAFPDGEFTIEELTTKLLAQHSYDPQALNNQLLDAIHSIGRQPLRAITVRTVGAVMQRNVAAVPISDADGAVWFIAPKPRTSGWDKVVWKITAKSDRAASAGCFEMATALNEGWEPREPREPQTKRMRANRILFGEEENKVSPAAAHPESGSPGSRGSHPIRPATSAYMAALSAGVRLTLRSALVEWTAEQEPAAELLAALRDHRAALVAILRGDACRWCGERLAWPGPVGVVFADGTGECMPCADREVWRLMAAGDHAVNAPDALADPAELTARGEELP